MIVVRNVFQMKFGKAREVKALLEEMKKLPMDPAMDKPRMLFDLVGPAYTLVWETTHKNLADFEAAMQSVMGADQWRDWYVRFSSHMDSSYREIFTVYA